MKHYKKSIGSIIIVLAFAILAAGSADTTKNTTPQDGSTTNQSQQNANATPEPPKEITYISVTANDLCSEYKNNEVAADKKYKDQYLEITGIVDRIDSSIGDMPVVHLKCGGEYSFDSVYCYFSSSDEAATLTKGKSMIIQGKSDGESIGSPQIRDCKIKK